MTRTSGNAGLAGNRERAGTTHGIFLRAPSKRVLGLLRHALIIGAVLGAAWYFIDFREVFAHLVLVQADWLLLLLVLATADRFLMAGKWLHLLRHAGSPAPFTAVLSAYYQAAFMQRVLPSSLGGDALRAVIVSRRFGGTSGVLATMVVEKLVAMLAAAFIALCGAVLLLAQARSQPLNLILVTLPLLLALTFLVLRLSLHRPLVTWAIDRLPGARLRRGLSKVYADYAKFRESPRTLIANFVYALIEQLVQVALLLSCALALNVDASIATLLAGIGIAQCVRKFAILLEGWLFSEFTAVLTYSLVGIPEAQALAFSLLGHAASIVAAIPGGFMFARSAVSLKDVGAWRRR